eukprot:gnl/TRDRNA2_/TRDRNA2_151172_c4_seq1.p1 gnl/TRDRNA2_/TRDRNA2_151172_c4~~gnl/TRDRNA2_/TRDRNA2_151172_c4_seq1.p1  ORF type:complete len:402 (-),score=66.10 gnl/TRDRNA2_/TRDRNA2_151172_c4_seq1:42-1247(-)
MSYCARMYLAHKKHILIDDVDVIMQLSSFNWSSSESQKDLAEFALIYELHEAAPSMLESFVKRKTSFHRFRIIFMAVHPVLSTRSYSITTSRATRAMFFMSQITSAWFLIALFFEASKLAVPAADPDLCKKTSGFAFIVRNVCIGLLSSLIANIPLWIMQLTMGRRFVYDDHWDEHKRAGYLWWWRLEDKVRWFCGMSNICCCITFVLIFHAQVSSEAQLDWCQGAVAVLVREFCLKPVGKALKLTTLATFFVAAYPDVVPTVLDELRREQLEVEQEEQALEEFANSQKISAHLPPKLTSGGSKADSSNSDSKVAKELVIVKSEIQKADQDIPLMAPLAAAEQAYPKRASRPLELDPEEPGKKDGVACEGIVMELLHVDTQGSPRQPGGRQPAGETFMIPL